MDMSIWDPIEHKESVQLLQEGKNKMISKWRSDRANTDKQIRANVWYDEKEVWK